MKFLFLSRHGLTAEQKADLTERGFTEFETVNPGVLTTSDDVVKVLIERNWDADGVGLVAPGRIWAGLIAHAQAAVEGEYNFPSFWEAESRQAPELRVGDGPIPFCHVTWHRVI